MTLAPTKPSRRERRTVSRNPSRSLKSATVPTNPIGMIPAPRAAKTQVCFGMNSPSASGSMPTDSAKSSAPRFSATRRGWARAISAMRKKADAVSTIASIFVVPTRMPRSASSSSMISATSWTCSALSALGSAIACTPGPITASRSRTVMRIGRLTRTTTSAPPRDTVAAASGTRVRARSFSEAATASSRSRIIASAPRLAAPSTNRYAVTGTNSIERHTGNSLGVILPVLLSHNAGSAGKPAGRHFEQHPDCRIEARPPAHVELAEPAADTVGIGGVDVHPMSYERFRPRGIDSLDVGALRQRGVLGVALDNGPNLGRQHVPGIRVGEQRKAGPPMRGQAQIALHLVETQRQHDAERIALPVEGFRLQRFIHAAERHHTGLGAERAEEIGGDFAARAANPEAGEITCRLDRPHIVGHVMKAVLKRAAERMKPGGFQLAADTVAERTVERRENGSAVGERERQHRQCAGRRYAAEQCTG